MTISAKVIADSISPAGIRLTTLQLRYPKFIHGEFLTHRVFSRNSSSSRAIPVERLIQDVIDDPVIPSFWGKNQKGMRADEECNAEMPVSYFTDRAGSLARDVFSITREKAWDKAREEAIAWAKSFSQAGYHKQIVNRLLEPFCHINTVVTATEWTNFFALRRHPDAQPEMCMLAEAIHSYFAPELRHRVTELEIGEWHLPYVYGEYGEHDLPLEQQIKISVARCARVSYLTQEGMHPTIEQDLQLYDRLMAQVPLHASPAEHQATPDKGIQGRSSILWNNKHQHGNFRGWIQYRKTLPGENQC